MKLIIDIDKEYYEILKHDVEHGNDYVPIKLIANGTPFDSVIEDIKAEIGDYFDWGDVSSTDQKAILEIIDNHISGKENEWHITVVKA